MFRSDILERQNISGESSALSYFHGCVSGIGIAAVCKIVALAFLVRVQVHPLCKIENYKKKVGEHMVNSLDIIDRQMEVGDVKTITSQNGKYVKLIELLFSSIAKGQFSPSDDGYEVNFFISDVNLDLPQYQSRLDKSTLYDLILALKTMYNQVKDKEE